MSVAVIIERIEASIAAGELRPVLDASGFLTVETVGDLLRPWGEIYAGADPEYVVSNGYIGIHSPRFTPVPRRSPLPLPAPRAIEPSPRTADPSLFASFRAIWDWYETRGLAEKGMPALPLDEKGLEAFVDPLFREIEGYWPLTSFLEELPYHFNLMGDEGISLWLPHTTYEEEGAQVVEAFLSGHRGVASLMSSLGDYMVETSHYDLPDKDVELIRKVEWPDLAETYEKYSGPKSYDLDKLYRWYDTFFGEVRERFPDQADRIEFTMISGDGGRDCEVWLECKEDIDFCIAYSDAFHSLIDAMPDPGLFILNEGGVAETFAHELCEVWRKVNRKRSVKWTSPKKSRLSVVFAEDIV